MSNDKIAVVDVQAVVENSAQVKALKEEQLTKTKDLDAWLKNAQAEVKAEADKAKQEALLQKYNAEFAQKRAELAQQYQEKLKVISESISQTVGEYAQNSGYSLVLSKHITLFGGIDITEEIAKIVK
ncbi:MAG: OmpH family outer membrane protein [Alphaproteobacteria bacterium]